MKAALPRAVHEPLSIEDVDLAEPWQGEMRGGAQPRLPALSHASVASR